jgi:uncharacterized protein (DUF4213/DUF364 family)
MNNIFDTLKTALQHELQRHHLSEQPVHVRCKALSAKEAIWSPEHDDYPIIRGKEVMVEADFEGAKGQAFTNEFEQAAYRVEELLTLKLDSNKARASFIAGLNAVYRYLGLCDNTIHCKDAEPEECARHVLEAIEPGKKVLLIGFQPRFLDILSANRQLRVIDLNPENIGKTINGVTVEPESMTGDALSWCDVIFATGSTLVNGTITRFLNQGKPAIFYGVTSAAAAKILNLQAYCECGH